MMVSSGREVMEMMMVSGREGGNGDDDGEWQGGR